MVSLPAWRDGRFSPAPRSTSSTKECFCRVHSHRFGGEFFLRRCRKQKPAPGPLVPQYHSVRDRLPRAPFPGKTNPAKTRSDPRTDDWPLQTACAAAPRPSVQGALRRFGSLFGNRGRRRRSIPGAARDPRDIFAGTEPRLFSALDALSTCHSTAARWWQSPWHERSWQSKLPDAAAPANRDTARHGLAGRTGRAPRRRNRRSAEPGVLAAALRSSTQPIPKLGPRAFALPAPSLGSW